MAVIVFTPEDKCFFQNKHLCNAENGDGECRWTSNKKLESCLASVNKDK